MSGGIATCPCCNSLVRVEPETATLEIVRIAKPAPSERWVPPRRRTVAAPVPLSEIETARQAELRDAVRVVSRVAREAGLSLSEIRSRSRRRDLVDTRQAAALAARRETAASLPQIGRILNRDHSTVLHGLRQLAAQSQPERTAHV